MYNFSTSLGAALIVMLPLIFGASWLVFRLIYGGKEDTRTTRIVISTAIVVGGMIYLQMSGRGDRYVFETSDYLEIMDGVITVILGSFWWGKHKKQPDDPDHA